MVPLLITLALLAADDTSARVRASLTAPELEAYGRVEAALRHKDATLMQHEDVGFAVNGKGRDVFRKPFVQAAARGELAMGEKPEGHWYGIYQKLIFRLDLPPNEAAQVVSRMNPLQLRILFATVTPTNAEEMRRAADRQVIGKKALHERIFWTTPEGLKALDERLALLDNELESLQATIKKFEKSDEQVERNIAASCQFAVRLFEAEKAELTALRKLTSK